MEVNPALQVMDNCSNVQQGAGKGSSELNDLRLVNFV